MQARTRQRIEELEHETLDDQAAFSDQSRGRLRPSDDDVYRTSFRRDCDKIIHCKSFRRLSHKTQVFISPEGDHYRTRLTHTLEVSQIARSIARGLGLNEDLVEAISLAHDLGHTPFGHTGEYALCACLHSHTTGTSDLSISNLKQRSSGYLDFYGEETSNVPHLFKHNEQSLRVVDRIENEGRGLNLSEEVRNGIVCHTGLQKAATLEGCIVGLADRIAYVNHDIDDALRAGLVDQDMLPESTVRILGATHADRIQTLVRNAIEHSVEAGEVALSPEVWDAMSELRTFLFEHVYRSEGVMVEVRKAYHLVINLFDYCIEHPDAVPDEYHAASEGDLVRAVTDYVGGMTDRYARTMFEDLFVPRSQARAYRTR